MSSAHLTENFEILFELLPQIMFMTGDDGQTPRLNPHWYRYTGHPPDSPLPEDWRYYLHPDDTEEMNRAFLANREARKPWTHEYRIRRRDGVFRWHLKHSVPRFSDSGEFVMWIGFATDIHDRKEAEANLQSHMDLLESQIAERTRELKQANIFLDSVIENIPNMIFVKDAKDLRFVRFNKAGENLIGVPRADLIGKNDFDLFPKSEAAAFTGADREVIKNKNVFDIPEEPISTKMGVRLLHTQKIPVYGDDGQPRYLVGISEDITERKQIEAERFQVASERIAREENVRITARFEFLSKASALLGASLDFERTLRTLTDLAVPGFADWCTIQLLDGQGKFNHIAVSHSDPSMVSWAIELQEKFPADMKAERGAPAVLRTGKSEMLNDIDPALIKAAAISDEQFEILIKLDLYSYVCAPIRIGERIIGTITLISTRESMRQYSEQDVQLIEQLGQRAGFAVENARLYKESNRLNAVKDEFLATLSHELRTPLNVIQGHAEILNQEASTMSPEELANSTQAILRNAQSQLTIVSDLLDVSSIITGKISFRPTFINAVEVLKKTTEALRPQADLKKVSLKICTSENESSFIWADATRLQQIITNLISNAIKFTPSGGSVEIDSSNVRTKWRLQVKDSGLGIEPEFLPYVFERFRQEDSSTSRRHGGLGLGLSIVRNLTELHNGTVRATSAGRGKGSTFEVSLPLDNASAAAHVEPHSDDRKAAVVAPTNALSDLSFKFEGLEILLVEDSVDNRVLLNRMLTKKGVRVFQADSAQMARRLLKTLKPDLILSDIGMPDENGLEFMRKLRSETSAAELPAIALTAYVRDEEKSAALEAGFQAHLGKPVSNGELLSTIANVLLKH